MKHFIKKQRKKTYLIGVTIFAITVLAGCGSQMTEPVSENIVIETEEKEVSYEQILEENVEESAQEIYDHSEFFEHMEIQMQMLEQEDQQRSQDGYDRQMAELAFDMVNEKRNEVGLPGLLWDEYLYETACIRAEDIVQEFSHDGCPDHLGENIAANYRSLNNLINAWMESEEHKENILDSRYTAAAVGCYICNGIFYWVQLFRF